MGVCVLVGRLELNVLVPVQAFAPDFNAATFVLTAVSTYCLFGSCAFDVARVVQVGETEKLLVPVQVLFNGYHSA